MSWFENVTIGNPTMQQSQSQFALLGYGALGRQMEFLLRTAWPPNTPAGFLYYDDVAVEEGVAGARPFAEWPQAPAGVRFYVGLGYKHLARKLDLIRALQAADRLAPAFTHPSGFISPSAEIEDGAFLYPGCNVDMRARVGAGALLNNSVVLSHDSVVGAGSFVAPGAVMFGQVEIGESVFIGAGAVIVNGVQIGAGAVVGAGTCVNRNVPANAHVIGNPMRILERPLSLT